MNCSNVQEAIWCGDLTADIQAHLAACAQCQQEFERVQKLNEAIEPANIPLPTRSLLPRPEKIEEAIKNSKRSRKIFPKSWITVSTITAAILLGLTQSSDLWPLELSAESDKAADATAAPESVAQKQTAFPEQAGMVVIDPTNNSSYREETESIRSFLNNRVEIDTLKQLTIETYTRDSIQGDTQTGRLSLWVENQPKRSSSFGKGDRPFRVEQYVELQKIQGVWTVTSTANTPFDFKLYSHNNYQIALPSAWKAIPDQKQDGGLVFQQGGQTVGGVELTPLRKGESNPLKAVQLPAQSEVVQAGLESYRGEDTVKYLLKRIDPATKAAGSLLEVHTYFLRGQIAYNVWLSNDAKLVPKETALAVTHSFQSLSPGQ